MIYRFDIIKYCDFSRFLSYIYTRSKLLIKYKEHFWNSFDAIKQDLINYIDNWIDISYYNYYKFKPYNFNDDKTEIVNAIIISQQNAKNFQNRTYARK